MAEPSSASLPDPDGNAQRWAVDQVGGHPVWLRTRPWAEVWRVDAVDGTWWLKLNTARTVYEPRLLAALAGLGSPLLPRVIVHPDQPWSLVADAGRSARELLVEASPEQRVDYWCRLLPAYAELQRAATELDLTGVGVPDFSPPRLLDRFDEVTSAIGWFDAATAGADGVAVRERFDAIRPRLQRAATRLAGGVPPTVQHDDLHDGNVFGGGDDDASTRVIDWGDAVVGHPFGTLQVTVRALAATLSRDRDDPSLTRVTDAYLEPWRTGGESRAALLEQCDLAVAVGALTRAAGWQRALGTPATAVAMEDGDAVAYWMLRLDEWLSA